jgi:3-methylcrotonyl-CoA carboxylase beta subunit
MRRIDSQINVNSDTYAENRIHQLKLVGELKDKLHAARHVRPQRDMDRLERQSKLYVRDRLELLLDPGSPFLELSTLAANQEYDGEVPSACTISGIGLVSGREVYIHADDASIKGGAWYPLTVKKMNRGLDIAIENRLPVIHLCDSAGGFLPLWAGLFPDARHGGRYFNSQCTLSQLGVPQISVVLGHCTAGGAYVPAAASFWAARPW